MSEQVNCKLCGEPMPEGEDMFFYHGYSGPCPKPPLPKVEPEPKPTFTAADLRRAREESEEKEQGRWQDRIYQRLRKIVPDVDGAGCESGDALDVTMTEINCIIGHLENVSDELRAELQKVREEATVAAAGAQREQCSLEVWCIGCCAQDLPPEERQWTPIIEGKHWKPNHVGEAHLGYLVCPREPIRNAPLVTSDEGAEWLRKHDAGVRTSLLTELRTLCNSRCQGCLMDWDLGRHGCHYGPSSPNSEEDESAEMMRCSMRPLRNWLTAQSTGTPAGTP